MAISIVCESTLMRDMLRAACQEAGHDVREVNVKTTSLTLFRDGDIILIHAMENGKDVVPAVSFLKSSGICAQIIILCASNLVDDLRKELGTSVEAIIPDTLHVDILIGTLTMVENGYKILHSDQMAEATETNIGTNEDMPVSKEVHPLNDILSRKETEVLAGLQGGLPNKTIGKQLGITEATVKVHLRAIYRKMGVKNRTQAALVGGNAGLFHIGPEPTG